ncbi:MAG: hypothetical protein ACQEWM_03265 [Actinomycetota bacterium]
MDGTWFSSVPLDGTWLTLLTTIGAVGAAGTLVALLRQRTPRTRVDLARVEGRSSPAH